MDTPKMLNAFNGTHYLQGNCSLL